MFLKVTMKPKFNLSNHKVHPNGRTFFFSDIVIVYWFICSSPSDNWKLITHYYQKLVSVTRWTHGVKAKRIIFLTKQGSEGSYTAKWWNFCFTLMAIKKLATTAYTPKPMWILGRRLLQMCSLNATAAEDVRDRKPLSIAEALHSLR